MSSRSHETPIFRNSESASAPYTLFTDTRSLPRVSATVCNGGDRCANVLDGFHDRARPAALSVSRGAAAAAPVHPVVPARQTHEHRMRIQALVISRARGEPEGASHSSRSAGSRGP